MKLTLLLIPILFFMTSCTSSNEKVNNHIPSNIDILSEGTRNLWYDFKIVQTTNETIVRYKNNDLIWWGHAQSGDSMPFTSQYNCNLLIKYSLPRERQIKEWRNVTWTRLVHNEKKTCMKEYLYNTIEISAWSSSGIYTLKSGIKDSDLWSVDTIIPNSDTNNPMPTLHIISEPTH